MAWWTILPTFGSRWTLRPTFATRRALAFATGRLAFAGSIARKRPVAGGGTAILGKWPLPRALRPLRCHIGNHLGRGNLFERDAVAIANGDHVEVARRQHGLHNSGDTRARHHHGKELFHLARLGGDQAVHVLRDQGRQALGHGEARALAHSVGRPAVEHIPRWNAPGLGGGNARRLESGIEFGEGAMRGGIGDGSAQRGANLGFGQRPAAFEQVKQIHFERLLAARARRLPGGAVAQQRVVIRKYRSRDQQRRLTQQSGGVGGLAAQQARRQLLGRGHTRIGIGLARQGKILGGAQRGPHQRGQQQRRPRRVEQAEAHVFEKRARVFLGAHGVAGDPPLAASLRFQFLVGHLVREPLRCA
jgi:hypothetical protein